MDCFGLKAGQQAGQNGIVLSERVAETVVQLLGAGQALSTVNQIRDCIF